MLILPGVLTRHLRRLELQQGLSRNWLARLASLLCPLVEFHPLRQQLPLQPMMIQTYLTTNNIILTSADASGKLTICAGTLVLFFFFSLGFVEIDTGCSPDASSAMLGSWEAVEGFRVKEEGRKVDKEAMEGKVSFTKSSFKAGLSTLRANLMEVRPAAMAGNMLALS